MNLFLQDNKTHAHQLIDATHPGEAADVLGTVMVIGADEVSRYVYFAAKGSLGDALARGAGAGDCKTNGPKGEGQCNIYLYHEGSTRLVARVAGADSPDWGLGENQLTSLTARVSRNGRYLAFMSEPPLTGYDNTDISTGKPDQEVFLYDAQAAGGEGQLRCASCDPTGAR
jgi:hypothetical protein